MAKFKHKEKKLKCRFCKQKMDKINYKDVGVLQNFLTPKNKLFSRKRSGTCARHQRQLSRAIKRARFIALFSY